MSTAPMSRSSSPNGNPAPANSFSPGTLHRVSPASQRLNAPAPKLAFAMLCPPWCALLALSLCATPPASTIHPAASLQSDFAVLRQAFEQLHPGLHRYNSPDELDQRFSMLKNDWNHDQTTAQAFLALSRFTASLKCGHTFPNPVNQPPAVKAELFDSAPSVPFTFKWLDNRMIITGAAFSSPPVPAGTEVLSLNDVSPSAILSTLLPYVRADGSNDAKRVSLLDVAENEQYHTFDVYYPLLFPNPSEKYRVRVRSPDGVVTAADLAAISPRDRAARMHHESPPDDPVLAWTLARREATPWYTMPSWVAYKSKVNWLARVNSTFDDLVAQGEPNLVIDLRGNEGGSSVGDAIIARLIQEPVPRMPARRYVRYLTIDPQLDAPLDTWDQSFKNWSKDAVGPVDLAADNTGLPPCCTSGFYRLLNQDGSDGAPDLILPHAPRFTGRVFVIIDSSNSSATFEFARLVKAHRLATLVGEPTGGNQRGINGGAFFFLRLPNSQLEIDLPLIAQFAWNAPSVPPDTGIAPDVFVPTTVADIASGADPVVRAIARIVHAP